MVNVRLERSSSGSRTTEPARHFPNNVAATARHESRSLGFSTMGRRKRSRLDIHGNTPPRGLDHEPVKWEADLTVGLNPGREDPHISYSVTFNGFVEDVTAGMIVDLSSQALSLSVRSVGGPVVSEEPIKSEMDAAVLF